MILFIYLSYFLGLCAIVADLAPRIGCVKASRALHGYLLHGILRAPLTFTDTTPIGRILSRFSKDVDTMDNKLPMEISDTLYCVMEVRIFSDSVKISQNQYLYYQTKEKFRFISHAMNWVLPRSCHFFTNSKLNFSRLIGFLMDIVPEFFLQFGGRISCQTRFFINLKTGPPKLRRLICVTTC